METILALPLKVRTSRGTGTHAPLRSVVNTSGCTHACGGLTHATRGKVSLTTTTQSGPFVYALLLASPTLSYAE